MQQLFENKYFIFSLATLFLLLFLTRHLGPSFDGVIKKRTCMPGVTGFDWGKQYDLNGTLAFTMGLIALIILTGLIYGRIVLATNAFFPK